MATQAALSFCCALGSEEGVFPLHVLIEHLYGFVNGVCSHFGTAVLPLFVVVRGIGYRHPA